MLAGRMFTANEDASHGRVAVLGGEVAGAAAGGRRATWWAARFS